jgi:hypothetical protein
VSEVEFRRTKAGRMLMARIYQPVGARPVPDRPGSARRRVERQKSLRRGADGPAIAASGVLVVAIDMTLAPEAPYPASVQDANYAVRWLKWKAPSWKGDPSKIGVYGSSSGGHVAKLLAMRLWTEAAATARGWSWVLRYTGASTRAMARATRRYRSTSRQSRKGWLVTLAPGVAIFGIGAARRSRVHAPVDRARP